ncbi:MAG: phosphopantothenoylcysteine decarboxylase [Phycisphaerales bacterium]
MTTRARLLITAGPTHEPIDAVRAIVNRSSGRLGCALADHAASQGWDVRVLLGPTALRPASAGVETILFTTTASLRERLAEHLAWCDVLVMAAAVADYRPAEPVTGTKLRRTPGELVLKLEPTPDLLAEASARARPDQLLVGFALEPAESMLASARAKLERKGVHAIVANPLETMDSDDIEATLVGAPCSGFEASEPTPGRMTKDAFAAWLLERIERARAATREGSTDA